MNRAASPMRCTKERKYSVGKTPFTLGLSKLKRGLVSPFARMQDQSKASTSSGKLLSHSEVRSRLYSAICLSPARTLSISSPRPCVLGLTSFGKSRSLDSVSCCEKQRRRAESFNENGDRARSPFLVRQALSGYDRMPFTTLPCT